jgi:hypothetical protein
MSTFFCRHCVRLYNFSPIVLEALQLMTFAELTHFPMLFGCVIEELIIYYFSLCCILQSVHV